MPAGNGTERAFYSDPGILFISIHQANLYPIDSGSAAARGEGDGEGFNLNIPMPPGTGVGGYLAAFERVILPALEAFDPEILLVRWKRIHNLRAFDAPSFCRPICISPAFSYHVPRIVCASPCCQLAERFLPPSSPPPLSPSLTHKYTSKGENYGDYLASQLWLRCLSAGSPLPHDGAQLLLWADCCEDAVSDANVDGAGEGCVLSRRWIL